MATVYIINEPREPSNPNGLSYNVEPAEMFGELVFVFENEGPRPGTNPEWAVEHAHEVLENAQPGDFVVWAGGDPMTMVIAAAILADVTEGQINYLAWNRSLSTYTPVPLALFNGE